MNVMNPRVFLEESNSILETQSGKDFLSLNLIYCLCTNMQNKTYKYICIFERIDSSPFSSLKGLELEVKVEVLLIEILSMVIGVAAVFTIMYSTSPIIQLNTILLLKVLKEPTD